MIWASDLCHSGAFQKLFEITGSVASCLFGRGLFKILQQSNLDGDHKT